MVLSRAMVRLLAAVFGGPSVVTCPEVTRCWQIITTRPSRSTSTHRSPAASPRRRPRRAISHHIAYSRSVSTKPRKSATCAAVHTATGYRCPVRCHYSTRCAVQTCACGRRGVGSSTNRAGLSRISRSRIAAFSAERNVARIRCSVDGVGRRP